MLWQVSIELGFPCSTTAELLFSFAVIRLCKHIAAFQNRVEWWRVTKNHLRVFGSKYSANYPTGSFDQASLPMA
jgi:hypothetical protein